MQLQQCMQQSRVHPCRTMQCHAAGTNSPPGIHQPERTLQQPYSTAPLIHIIMGVSGCGKSSVGSLLASSLQCPFYDGDDFHPAANIRECAHSQAGAASLACTPAGAHGGRLTQRRIVHAGKMQGGSPLTDEDRWPWLERLVQLLAEHIAG